MKILFVCSGNSENFNVAPFVKSQANSLQRIGIEVEFYTIKGKGLTGYLGNIAPLRKQISKNKYDIIHSHYSLSGWVSSLTYTNVPKVVSYMGSDTYGNIGKNGRLKPSSIINIFSAKSLQFFVSKIIVKSQNLKEYVNLKEKTEIIPNGININKFKPKDKIYARKKLSLEEKAEYVLFLGDKKDPRKNYQLVESAKRECNEKFTLLSPYPVPHEKVPLYMNAADVLVLASYKEGSPNIIKEAMACNVPIVSTNVGDVEWVFGDIDGCFLAPYDPGSYADKLRKALNFDDRTFGRKRIKEVGLDTESIAEKLIELYESVLYQ